MFMALVLFLILQVFILRLKEMSPITQVSQLGSGRPGLGSRSNFEAPAGNFYSSHTAAWSLPANRYGIL